MLCFSYKRYNYFALGYYRMGERGRQERRGGGDEGEGKGEEKS